MTDSRKSVLIVEDDGPTRMLEVVVLREAGYTVLQARDGEIALQQLTPPPSPPDLVLLDLRLPGVDGWSVLEHIAQMPVRPRVVLVTGVHSVRIPEHLKTYVEQVVAKPFDASDLLNVCARVLAPS
jgi:two-component system cell cycle sensor histidine kinase/response regulator CckA